MARDEFKIGNDKSRHSLEKSLQEKARREGTYRERALKLFPWVCGGCGREFSGSKLRELTVHHKDYNHDNNPPDGSNWELLCLHCHEYEHAEQASAPWLQGGGPARPGTKPDTTHQPFAGLTDLFKDKPLPDAEDE